MLKNANPCLVLLSLVCARAVIFGASIGDAIAIAALAGLYGCNHYLKSKEEPPVNEELKRELADLKSTVNAIKVGRAFGR